MKVFLPYLVASSFVTPLLASPHPDISTKTVAGEQTPLPSYQDAHTGYLSQVARLATSPKHAWWSHALKRKTQSTKTVNKIKVKRDDGQANLSPSNPAVDATIIFNITTTVLPTPTFCSYMPSTSDCYTGCICGPSCSSIYITNYTLLSAVNANEPNASLGPNYHICVNWQLNYPAQLSYAFQEVGFAVLPGAPYQCGWQQWGSVTALRVSRGSIDVNGTLEFDRGDPDELMLIEEVLNREYPFVEILVLCATLVGPAVMLFGMCAWMAMRPREGKEGRGLYRRL